MNGRNTIPRQSKQTPPSAPAAQSRMKASEYRKQYCQPPEKKQGSVTKGRRNQENGKAFEKMLEAACEKYREEKLAKVSKSVEPFRIVGVLNNAPKVYKCVEEKEGEPDFKGILSTGLGIAFEAKHTDQDRIEWAAVKEHQRQHLEEHAEMRGLAFVMVSFGLKRFFRIPWLVWRDMKELYGRKYLRADEISEFEVPLVIHYGKPAVLFLDDIEETSLVKGDGHEN